MRAREKDFALAERLYQAGIKATTNDANTLRRAERTLQRWAERECGDGSGWHVERDEATGKPYNFRDDSEKGYPCADLEAGALRRVKALCKANGWHYFHQTDPRGCMLYVSPEPISENAYTNGVACCA